MIDEQDAVEVIDLVLQAGGEQPVGLDFVRRALEVEANGLMATCLQHEIDHLNGILFIDHLSKLKRDMIIKKFTKAAKRAG